MCKNIFNCLLVVLCSALLLWPGTLVAQESSEGDAFKRISAYFASLSDFDYRYPREAVYLHLDNNGYFEGETLWFKAYVVRASSLSPQPVSRVLYTELLDADGELVERKLLRIDSIGQANGEFKLDLPVRGGEFYEIRAFTREMLNWGERAYFSRVIPVFRKNDAQSDSPLEIQRPQSEADLNDGHPRPWYFKHRKEPNLTFYPEGGNRVAGLSGRIAYELETGGEDSQDTVYIYDTSGHLLTTSVPLHEGRGIFTLPAISQDAYAIVQGKRFNLPEAPSNAHYALTAQMDGDLDIIVQRRPDVNPELLGLAVMCRDEAVYFDTLTVGSMPVQLQVSRKLLGDGVNRIELFDSHGHSLARRLVWGPPTARRISMRVAQNATQYEPFSPIVLDIHLTDAFGKPVEACFSLSVRESQSDIAANTEPDLATQLLLCSELRGHIADPSWYFMRNDQPRRQALDALLMVQGWTANSFEDMTKGDSLNLQYPIEDRLILQGRVLRNNNKGQAQANTTLSLLMFNREGYSLQSQAVTDSLGRFVFASNEDYTGDWIAQFSTRIGEKPVWSRVALQRWFSPTPRPIGSHETRIRPPHPIDSIAPPALFAWTDTLPPATVNPTIGTATVTYRGWRGRRGNKYTYQGGEKAGMRQASIYYNIEQIVERLKDDGKNPELIWDLLSQKDKAFYYFPDLDTSDRQYMKLLEAIDDSSIAQTGPVYMFRYAGRPALIFIDNELFLQRRKGDNPVIFADEVKSIIIMRQPTQWQRFLPTSIIPSDNLLSLNPPAIFLYTRPDYSYYRTKKGIEKRTIHGFSLPTNFYNPDYRTVDIPDANDHRRTLYWNPNQHTNAQGRTTALFFSNAHPQQQIAVSARGITSAARIIHYETP